MTNPTEQILASTKSAVADFTSFANTAFSGIEKLAEVNMAAVKNVFADASAQAKALMSVKTPEDFTALQSGGVQPLVEKVTAYSRSVYEIASGTGAELAQACESRIAGAQKSFAANVDAALQHAPEGSEAAVAVFKNAIAASQNAIESAQTSAKKVFEFAEKNVANAAEATVKSVKTAAKSK